MGFQDAPVVADRVRSAGVFCTSIPLEMTCIPKPPGSATIHSKARLISVSINGTEATAPAIEDQICRIRLRRGEESGGVEHFPGAQRGATKTIKTLAIFRVATGVQGQSRNFDAETANLACQAWFTDGSWAVFRITH